MNNDLLCTWLGLAEKRWPPDPYQLLGVAPGEKDVARIEQCVHERLCRLRGYQVSHPEEATEGMNCLAQAFITITDCLSREMSRKATPVTVATASLPKVVRFGTAVPPPAKRAVTRDDTAVGRKTEVNWHNTPPPVRNSTIDDTVNGPIGNIADTVTESRPLASPNPAVDPAWPALSCSPVETVCQAARDSAEARKGLNTLPDLLERISQTRKLSIAWKRLGKYLRDPKRTLCRQSEETDLARWMDYLFELLEDYPRFIAHPGRSGYRVAAMARLEKTAHMFKGLDSHQREEMARDWEAGELVLREHRRFLLERVKEAKRRSWADRWATEASGFVRQNLVWVLATLGSVVAALLYFNLR